jgi:hypothetical protein
MDSQSLPHEKYPISEHVNHETTIRHQTKLLRLSDSSGGQESANNTVYSHEAMAHSSDRESLDDPFVDDTGSPPRFETRASKNRERLKSAWRRVSGTLRGKKQVLPATGSTESVATDQKPHEKRKASNSEPLQVIVNEKKSRRAHRSSAPSLLESPPLPGLDSISLNLGMPQPSMANQSTVTFHSPTKSITSSMRILYDGRSNDSGFFDTTSESTSRTSGEHFGKTYPQDDLKHDTVTHWQTSYTAMDRMLNFSMQERIHAMEIAQLEARFNSQVAMLRAEMFRALDKFERRASGSMRGPISRTPWWQLDQKRATSSEYAYTPMSPPAYTGSPNVNGTTEE